MLCFTSTRLQVFSRRMLSKADAARVSLHGQVERERGAISLLPGFEIVEEPADVGEEEVADLGLILERRFDLGKGVFQVPMPVGKGKGGPDLFQVRCVLPVA
jgi:hypothetical protein